jgi:plastocyanin
MTNHSVPNRSLRRLGFAACAVLFLAVAACSDDDDDPVSADEETTTSASAEGDDTTTTADDGGAADGATVEAVDFEFTSATVAPGAEVTFENADGAPHTMTADDGSFDSGTVAAGESGTVTAPSEPGEHAFHCEIHPQMTGTLTVES